TNSENCAIVGTKRSRNCRLATANNWVTKSRCQPFAKGLRIPSLPSRYRSVESEKQRQAWLLHRDPRHAKRKVREVCAVHQLRVSIAFAFALQNPSAWCYLC